MASSTGDIASPRAEVQPASPILFASNEKAVLIDRSLPVGTATKSNLLQRRKRTMKPIITDLPTTIDDQCIPYEHFSLPPPIHVTLNERHSAIKLAEAAPWYDNITEEAFQKELFDIDTIAEDVKDLNQICGWAAEFNADFDFLEPWFLSFHGEGIDAGARDWEEWLENKAEEALQNDLFGDIRTAQDKREHQDLAFDEATEAYADLEYLRAECGESDLDTEISDRAGWYGNKTEEAIQKDCIGTDTSVPDEEERDLEHLRAWFENDHTNGAATRTAEPDEHETVNTLQKDHFRVGLTGLGVDDATKEQYNVSEPPTEAYHEHSQTATIKITFGKLSGDEIEKIVRPVLAKYRAEEPVEKTERNIQVAASETLPAIVDLAATYEARGAKDDSVDSDEGLNDSEWVIV